MPILVMAPPVFTPEQEVRVREIIREEIQTWYSAAIPNVKDRDGKPYTHYQADLRGVYGYDAIRLGGVLEKRVTATETASGEQAVNLLAIAGKVAAVELLSQQEATDQDRIEDALDKPILDKP